ERPGGSEDHGGTPALSAMRKHVFRRHGGEKIQLSSVLRVGSHRVMNQVSFETSCGPVNFHTCVQDADEFAAVPPVETQFVIGIPTRMANPAAKIICHQGKVVSDLL